MKNGAVKVAVSVPRAVYEKIEAERKRRKSGRSELFVEALEGWLKKREEAAQVRQYIQGYRRIPESEKESKWLTKAAAKAIGSEEWK